MIRRGSAVPAAVTKQFDLTQFDTPIDTPAEQRAKKVENDLPIIPRYAVMCKQLCDGFSEKSWENAQEILEKEKLTAIVWGLCNLHLQKKQL